jgi:hypothetical protein
MRVIIEVWVFGLALAVIPFWSKWYLPAEVRVTKYISSGELTISLLWLIHFSVRFPFSSINRGVAKEYLR